MSLAGGTRVIVVDRTEDKSVFWLKTRGPACELDTNFVASKALTLHDGGKLCGSRVLSENKADTMRWIGAILGSFIAAVAWADPATIEPGFKPLFNGRDLSQWEGVTSDASASWKVDDGTIVCTGEKGTWLRSKEQYDDFNLRFEYRLKAGGNSGIYVRVPADGAHREEGGAEIQILDDNDGRYRNISPGQYGGSVYKVAPATQHVGRPIGEWNTMEIDCQGTNYRVKHNGTLIVDANETQFPELKQRFLKGYLGLQNHSEEVWFRNLRVGPPQPR